jgi:hypothetical protein
LPRPRARAFPPGGMFDNTISAAAIGNALTLQALLAHIA